ncbi:MAG: OmpH family outer membrane protein [Flavobacteriales bacterium]|jgi:outer membrane protein|nr:OmpH family outer membrane protein [Flavobacteriales bacterium]
MKKLIFILTLFLGFNMANAQKFCYVDSKYILSEIPEYNIALEKIDELSAKWQKEIEEEQIAIDKMFEMYQAEQALLTPDLKLSREDEIIKKERKLKDLKRKYFGPNGKLFEKQKSYLQPIQEKVQAAINEYAQKKRYAIVFDKAGELVMLYSDPKFDVSDEILNKLGY